MLNDSNISCTGEVDKVSLTSCIEEFHLVLEHCVWPFWLSLSCFFFSQTMFGTTGCEARRGQVPLTYQTLNWPWLASCISIIQVKSKNNWDVNLFKYVYLKLASTAEFLNCFIVQTNDEQHWLCHGSEIAYVIRDAVVATFQLQVRHNRKLTRFHCLFSSQWNHNLRN